MKRTGKKGWQHCKIFINPDIFIVYQDSDAELKAQVQRTLCFVTIPKELPPKSVRCCCTKLGHRSTAPCPTSSKCRSQWRTKNVPWLLSQYASHEGRPSCYQSSQRPCKPHIPRRWNSARNSLLNCKAKKTQLALGKTKPALGCQSCWTLSKVYTCPACSFVVRTKCLWSRMPGTDQSTYLVEQYRLWDSVSWWVLAY